jgi:RHS repeat-associated protein
MTYAYNNAGQVTSQTGTGVGATTMTYTADGAIKTVTDSTGTTSYTYDALTSQLSRIDNSNGSSIAYTYDLVGRVKTQTERATAISAGYTTEYNYDTFGNLNWVKDPAGGITTMKYDTLNRLKERNLPNGMKTEWAYDQLDRIQSVTHKAANGDIISSVSYDRNASGEPSKITREDGTYTKLLYDTALRITKESFYNAQNVLLDETTYVYDAAGKRIAKVTALDNQTYVYDKGYQLDSITGTNPEDYAYDTNGRMDVIQRDGKTLDLDHDVYDRLTAVKNLTSSTTTNYVYDGQGRRITATTGSETRKFLIAPVMGGGLDSTDMMLDGSGNMTANYVYAGGSSPFMKLDANGNPVYYLTDGMGSVIGMANQSGQSMAKFSYDSFGNIRMQSGNMADTTGGDFRFQGQWLESATGIYNFRARDYDSKTGTFLSRDPVDPNSQQPEAMNPYQAMYNNPYVYSDPTGMISLAEINAAEAIQKIFDGIKSRAVNEIREEAIDQAKGVATRVLSQLVKTIVPFDFSPYMPDGKHGNMFEKLFRDTVCEVLGGNNIPFFDHLWFDVGLNKKTGAPENPGFGCGPAPTFAPNPIGLNSNFSNPDLIIKKGEPVSTDKKPKAYLIGDLKYSIDSIKPQSDTQLNAILSYAKLQNAGKSQYQKNGGHQYVPYVLYFSVDPAGLSKKEESIEHKIKNWALEKHGVLFELLSFR